MSYAGVQTMKIYLDGKVLANPNDKSDIFILRRAPGNQNYNYLQMIRFCEPENHVKSYNCSSTSIVESCPSIRGFVVQIVIYSTWGDKYYCGLNGLKLFDERNQEIFLGTQSK